MLHKFYFILFIIIVFTFNAQVNYSADVYDIDTLSKNKYAFIDELIKDKTVIALGELSHSDGTTFIHKTELIKYLHQKHQFNTILFESDFINMTIENDVRKNYDSLVSNLFSVWKNVNETQNLFAYIKNNNLNFNGFDCQFYNNKLHIEDSIATIFKLQLDTLKQKKEFINTLKLLLNNYGKSHKIFTKKQKIQFITVCNLILNTSDVTLFWTQALSSIKHFALASWQKNIEFAVNSRDEGMAKNIIWLQNNIYKNQKIIIWAASEHVCTNQHIVYHKKIKNNNYSTIYMMGDYLKPNFKEKLFTISFIYNKGTTQWANQNYNANRSINSLEFTLAKKYNYAFITTKNLLNSLVNGIDTHNKYGAKTTNWNQVCNGFYFINNMKCSTRK